MNKRELSVALGKLYHTFHQRNMPDARELAYVLYSLVEYDYFQLQGMECGVSDADSLKVSRRVNGRTTTTSFKKWVEWVLRQEWIPSDYTITEEMRASVEQLATFWGEINVSKVYTFEVVSGQDLIEAYRAGPRSCMSGNAGDGRTLFYADNGVELVKILENGTYMGRALLWTLVDGRKFLDRVYPSDQGAHTRKVREWARSQGWVVRATDSAGDRQAEEPGVELRVKVDTFTAVNTPFLDTLVWGTADRDGNIYLTADNTLKDNVWYGEFGFYRDGDGRYHYNWTTTGLFGRRAPVWEFTQTLDGFAHRDDLHRFERFGNDLGLPENVMYCMVSGRRTHLGHMVTAYVGGYQVMVHPDEAVPPHERSYHARHGMFLRRDAVQLTAGYAAGLWATKADTITVDGQVWDRATWAYIEEQDQMNARYVVVAFGPQDTPRRDPWVHDYRDSLGTVNWTYRLPSGAEVSVHEYSHRRWYYNVPPSALREFYETFTGTRPEADTEAA